MFGHRHYRLSQQKIRHKMNRYDIIIIGAGLAGLSAAKELSGSKLKVLLVEKEKELDSHMAGMFHPTVVKFGLQKAVRTKVNNLLFVTPEEKSMFDFSKEKEEYVDYVDLKEACRILSRKIRCELKRDTEIINAEYYDGGIMLLDISQKKYFARLVIDCSGNAAVAATSLGIKKSMVYNETLSGNIRCRIDTKKVGSSIQYQDRTITKNAGAWIVPLNKKKANVGISSYVPYFSPSRQDLERRLNLFLVKMDKRFHLGLDLKSLKDIRHKKSPVVQPIYPMYKDHLLVAGDAAGQATSFYGMGTETALEMGKAAADIAVNAFKNNCTEARFLRYYENIWWRMFGRYDELSTYLRHYIINYFKDDEWDRINRRLQGLSPKEFYLFLRSKYSLGMMIKMFSAGIFAAVMFNALRRKFLVLTRSRRKFISRYI